MAFCIKSRANISISAHSNMDTIVHSRLLRCLLTDTISELDIKLDWILKWEKIRLNSRRKLVLVQRLQWNSYCDNESLRLIHCGTMVRSHMIWEQCLQIGVYPFSWKKANIIPWHKINSKQCRECRLISPLPIFRKIFKRLIFNSIYRHMCFNAVLKSHHSGIRSDNSTINRLLSVIHNIWNDTVQRISSSLLIDWKHLANYGTRNFCMRSNVKVL